MSSNNVSKDNYSAKLRFKSILLFLVCVLLTIICLLPIYILIINATRTSAEVTGGVSLIPGNYLKEKNLEVIFQIYKDDAANASERGKNERKKNHSRRG